MITPKPPVYNLLYSMYVVFSNQLVQDDQTRDDRATRQKAIPYSSSRFDIFRVAGWQASRQGLVSSRRNQACTGSGRSIAGTGSCSGTTLLVRKTNLLRTTPAFFLTTLLASNLRAPSWVLSNRNGGMCACDPRYSLITSEVPGSGQFWQGVDLLKRTPKTVKKLSFVYKIIGQGDQHTKKIILLC